jgi:hypothetical protein
MVKKTGLICSFALLITFTVQALTISGTVTNASNNNAIIGAIVTFRTIVGGGVNIYSDTTIAAGAYQLLNIPAGSSGTLTVTAAGFQQNQQLLQNLQANQTINVDLIPTGTGTGFKRIFGTVTEAGSANAVAGAQIILLLRAGVAATTPVDTDISAADGKYTFDSLASGRYDIVVTKTGFLGNTAATNLNLTIVDSLVVNIQLTPVGNRVGTLTGTVTAADTAVLLANARVLLTRTTVVGGGVTTVSVDSTLTNANGVYTISGVPAATGYRLTASMTGYVAASSPGTFRVDSAVTRTENFRLAAVVVPAGIVNGTVTDSGSLAAIQGALVVLRRLQAGLVWARVDSAVTAPNGSFAFAGLDIGTYSLVVSKADYLTYTTPFNRAVNLITNPDTATVAVALAPVPKGNLHVFVRDNANNAIPGASVTVLQRMGGIAPGQTYNGATAGDGWAAFTTIIAGPYDITVSKPGFNTTTRTGQQVAAGANDTAIITLQAATGSSKVIKGTVRNAAGAGIGTAVVVLTARAGGGSTLALVDTCGSDGSYGITGIPAGYTVAAVSVMKTGYMQKDSAGIAIINDTTTVNIVLAPNAGVTSLPGMAQAGLRVTILKNGIYLSGVRRDMPVRVALYSVNGQVVYDRTVYIAQASFMVPKTWSSQIVFLQVEQGSKVIRQKITFR